MKLPASVTASTPSSSSDGPPKKKAKKSGIMSFFSKAGAKATEKKAPKAEAPAKISPEAKAQAKDAPSPGSVSNEESADSIVQESGDAKAEETAQTATPEKKRKSGGIANFFGKPGASSASKKAKKSSKAAAPSAAPAVKKAPAAPAASSSAVAPNTSYASNKVKGSYHPIDSATWKNGKPVPYSAIVDVFEKIEATTKRLEIQDLLCSLFRSIIVLTPEDLLPAVYLACNQVAPGFENVELGLGEALLKKAIVQTTGTDLKFVNKQYVKLGDLGSVAMHYKGKQKSLMFSKPKPLVLRQVFQKFKEIAAISGGKSQEKKVGNIKKMLVDSKGAESKYVIRGLQGKLRIGLAEATVLVALGQAVTISNKDTLDSRIGMGSEKFDTLLEQNIINVKQAFSELPSYDKIVPALLSVGCEKVNEVCQLSAGIPVKPMLAKPTKGVSEVLDRFEGLEFTCEFKYDGERGQVHLLEDGTIKVFSRNMEENTSKYPDIISMLPQTLKPGVTSCIMDSEIIAYDRVAKKLMPFQSLSTRAKKDTKEEDIKIQVIMTAFDLLYLNGESLLQKPLGERRKLLLENFQEVEGKFTFAIGKDATKMSEIEEFLDESIKGNCEGLMVKTLYKDATYEPSRRSLNWLKLKKDYLEGMGDTLDLVPIGAWRGKGKRTGWYGAYLCACYNPDEEEFQTVCKIGTGFSEENLETFYKFFNEEGKDRLLPSKPLDYNVRADAAMLRPDVWLKADMVWEVKAADLSISPAHTAAIGEAHDTKGIALRFPRLERVRDDKDVLDATTSDQVFTMFSEQDNRQ